MSEHVGLRERAWFQTLTGKNEPLAGDPGSVLAKSTVQVNTYRRL
jgi:malonate decarboxylase gamma subunit